MITGNAADSITFLEKGKIILYPTEAVYGLGCDPFNENAVNKIYKIKKRPMDKKMIIIGSKLEHFDHLIDLEKLNNKVLKSWPGHKTWLIPAKDNCPEWLKDSNTGLIAIRCSNHATVKEICNNYKNPIISTSANISGSKILQTSTEIANLLGDNIDFIVDGSIGNEKKPSIIEIMDTGKIIRT
ncbi:MAG: threonylcarbamoyl-AMP synthase [Gammaproteobacteria bacterium]|nr:threonylcarbamoyl-AMP synthase [Gammaproteobacteria bacterium]|tara:strand:- start:336 stop:887 length:552 start_codon:yes stop_codon:yes gene_type:complete